MFSGLYDALNQGVSAVLPEISPNASPTRPSDTQSSPRSSLGGNPMSPSRSGTMSPTEGSPGYSTYQRRTKPSLEDRLRASLAAKEQKRIVSEREKHVLPMMGEEEPGLAPVIRVPERVVAVASVSASAAPNEGTTPQYGEQQDDNAQAHNVALPASPPLQNANTFQHLAVEAPETPIVPADAPKELPLAPTEPKAEPAPEEQPIQLPNTVPPVPPEKQIQVPQLLEEIQERTEPSTPTPPASVALQPTSTIPSMPKEPTEQSGPPKEPEPPAKPEDGPIQTITLPPPPPPSKYDDPLTPALLELEKERQAAANKARSARSPPRAASIIAPSPSAGSFGMSPSPSKQGFGHARSKSAAVPATGEPFIRFGGSEMGSREMGSMPSSLEHMLRRPGALDGLGIEGVHDEEGLRAWVEGLKQKAAASQKEVARLQAKLLQQDGRMDEVRDTHRLESTSQSELIESLRQKNQHLSSHLMSLESGLAAERALLSAERSTRESLISAERAKHSTGLSDLEAFKERLKEREEEAERLQALAKEEEEKRTKAISLLKTVRTKLVKAEKDRDDVQKELVLLRENAGAGERGREEELRGMRSELDRVRNELERTRMDGAREIERVREDSVREFERRRQQLENEIGQLRDAMEREVLARRGEWEIEGIAAKTTHQKEVANLNSRIATLTTSLNQISDEKSALFFDLQFRTSDLESVRTELEDLQSQLTEANYQLRERDEQLTMVQVELSEARRVSSSSSGAGMSGGATGGAPSGPEVARLLAAAESRSESRVLELRSRLRAIEAERAEQEETWTRSLASRTDEIERLRGLLSAQENEGRRVGDYKVEKEREVQVLEEKLRVLEGEKFEFKRRLKALEGETGGLREKLDGRDEEASGLKERVEGLTGSLEELRGKEAQLKLSNKTLREELRKVQSSAALLERQRNPGVGYWASGPRTPLNGHTFSDSMASSSTPDLSRNAAAASQGRPGTPGTPASAVNGASGSGRAPSTAGSARSSMEVSGSAQGDEEVNLEYLRNVILQFLEHEKMRPGLVRVLSVILRFTPQETRRLIAKV